MLREGLASVLLLILPGAQGSPATAQSYVETERVTVIDLPVALKPASRPDDPERKPPQDLAPTDFEVLLDGSAIEPVAVVPITGTGPLPHEVLIYIDAALTDQQELEDSLELIAEMAVKLGMSAIVHIVIADPEPRYLLQDGTDPQVVENLLASSSWGDAASDELRALRAGFLEALEDTETEIDLASLQTAFALAERRLVQRRLDRLLSFVAGHPGSSKQQVLLLVGLQFDLQPMDFYSAWVSEAKSPGVSTVQPAPPLEESVRALAANLGGFGWIAWPVAAPERESPLQTGLRIGKWRIKGPAGGRVIGVRIAHEAERDPELARGHLQNGQALLQAGSATEAEAAFRLALHHFHGDDRTAEEQAQAAAGLAEALEAQGRSIKARGTLRTAADLDPSVADSHPEALASLLDPTASLATIAGETSGRVIIESTDLEQALVGLQRRLRLSIQMAGDPTGLLYPIEVRSLRARRVAESPKWVRFGSPAGVAAARVRLLRDDGEIASPQALDAVIERLPGGSGAARLEFRLPSTDAEGSPDSAQERTCRLTSTLLEEDQPAELAQQLVDCRLIAGNVEGAADFSLPQQAQLLGVLVEDVANGEWGAEILEIAD